MSQSEAEKKYGVISDTHGLIRPGAVEALRGTSLIFHVGDIGSPKVLDALETLAPVIAVRGNCDRGDWAGMLPSVRAITIGAYKILLVHNRKSLPDQPESRDYHLLICGHSHKPQFVQVQGRYILNPGSAGPRRFNLPVSLAVFQMANGIKIQWHELI